MGEADSQPPHETFYYYRGYRLQAVRHGDWKLELPPAKNPNANAKPKLYNLKTDIGEATDLAAANLDVVKKLESLVEDMKGDLGLDGDGTRFTSAGQSRRCPAFDRR